MKEIDWSKAPEGAQFWGAETFRYCEAFYKKVDDDWFYACEYRGWKWYSLGGAPGIERIGQLVRIPIAEWSDEDLPPVGVIVKLRTKRSPEDAFEGWGKAEIMYSSKGAVVWRWQGHSREFGAEWHDVEFEAIRTPEQIAAEERELAIQQMCEDAGKPDMPLRAREQAGMLYDAGWRKQEQPK